MAWGMAQGAGGHLPQVAGLEPGRTDGVMAQAQGKWGLGSGD